jgi:tetratricopeptide (TPR) repeat protein
MTPTVMLIAALAQPAPAARLGIVDGWRACKAGAALREQGKPAEAVEELLKGARLRPTARCLYDLGRSAFEAKRYQLAIDSMRDALRRDPGVSVNAYRYLGDALAITGRHTEAGSVYEAGSAKFPDNNTLWQMSTVAAFASGGEEGAKKIYTAHGSGYHSTRDLILANLKIWAEAARERGLSYGSLYNHAAIYRFLGAAPLDCQKTRLDRNAALHAVYTAYLRAPLKPLPTEGSLRLAKEGNVLAQEGDWTGALGRYVAALEQSPWWADIHFNLGMAGIVGEADLRDSGVSQLKHSLILEPQGPSAEKARRKLKELKADAPLAGLYTTEFTDACRNSQWGI